MSGSFVHKIIIAGCRRFASPLPSGPHKRMKMRIAKRSTAGHRRSWLVLVGLVLVALMMLAVLAITQLAQPDVGAVSSPTQLSDQTQPSPAPTSTVSPQDEVVERLHEIFRIRDKAIRTRDAILLEDIYTVDCPCLEGDRKLIGQLRRDRLVWRGIKVSLDVQEVERVNDRLWIVSALVTTSPFEILDESGTSVRTIPQGQELSRFALARPVDQRHWLLGKASVIEGRD